MKDRTPKFPGRVKLKPVSGQTDTYDMTRADDPDDTGTPFNTRTMLQDSTGQFLKLPLANPFPDDAFRHMVDRIVPIGTIWTSPAQSLGDAWLKCDGSQVTFTEYPQLCQMLRSTAGGVSWELTQVGTAPDFKGMSRPVMFNGKWYVAGTYRNGDNFESDFTLKVASADSIIGPYTIIHTKTIHAPTHTDIVAVDCVQMAASEETIAAVWTGSAGTFGNTIPTTFITWSDDGETWNTRSVGFGEGTTSGEIGTLTLSDFQTDGTCWAIADDASGSDVNVKYCVITDIKNDTTWTRRKGINGMKISGLSYVNGLWFLISKYSDGTVLINTARSLLGSWTMHSAGKIASAFAGSQVAFYNNKYWTFISTSGSVNYIAFSQDLTSWSVSKEEELSGPSNRIGLLIANNRQMACSSSAKVFTTSDPDVGWNQVTLPEGAPTGNLSSYEDILVTTGENALAYHDYATETRTLPTISLSSDTTTFIKAKNELDVFEAQQSGG